MKSTHFFDPMVAHLSRSICYLYDIAAMLLFTSINSSKVADLDTGTNSCVFVIKIDIVLLVIILAQRVQVERYRDVFPFITIDLILEAVPGLARATLSSPHCYMQSTKFRYYDDAWAANESSGGVPPGTNTAI